MTEQERKDFKEGKFISLFYILGKSNTGESIVSKVNMTKAELAEKFTVEGRKANRNSDGAVFYTDAIAPLTAELEQAKEGKE